MSLACQIEITTVNSLPGVSVFCKEELCQNGSGRIYQHEEVYSSSLFNQSLHIFLIKFCNNLTARGIIRLKAHLYLAPNGGEMNEFHVESLDIEMKSGFCTVGEYRAWCTAVHDNQVPEFERVSALIAWHLISHFENFIPGTFTCVMCQHPHSPIPVWGEILPPDRCENLSCTSHHLNDIIGTFPRAVSRTLAPLDPPATTKPGSVQLLLSRLFRRQPTSPTESR